MFTHDELEWIKSTAAKASNVDMDEMAEQILRKIKASQVVPKFKTGDKVKHKKDDSVYLGEVLEISKTGKTVRVQWTEYNKRVHIFGSPWPAYYRLDHLELVKEASNT